MEGYADWRGRPVNKLQHGGNRAAAFILGVVALESVALVAVGNNLLLYLFHDMHFSLASSANIVTNFIGTGMIMSLVGAYLSDALITRFWTIFLFGLVEFAGLVLLAIQAYLPSLRPAPCNMLQLETKCDVANGLQKTVLYTAFFLLTLGTGSVNVNLMAMGANQFDVKDPKERALLSSFFNKIFFSVSVGSLLSTTVLVWVQENKGRDLGFALSAVAMFLAVATIASGYSFYRNKIPQGSPLTKVAQVFAAAFHKRGLKFPLGSENFEGSVSQTGNPLVLHTDQFRCLNKAAIIDKRAGDCKEGPWKLASIYEVEEVKSILRMIPILCCTVVINCAYAQFQTFFLQQGSTMNNNLGNFQMPVASLAAIPLIFSMILAPIYDKLFVKLSRRVSGREGGISPLQRIGAGLAFSAVAIAVAALVEEKRKRSAVMEGIVNRTDIQLSLSIFWLAPQLVIFSLAGFFTTVGFIELLYHQSPPGMHSLCTSLSFISSAIGYYFSSIIISAINAMTSHSKDGAWLLSNNVNVDYLDRFYWLLCGLSVLNSMIYIVLSKWFRYKQAVAAPQEGNESMRLGRDGLSV